MEVVLEDGGTSKSFGKIGGTLKSLCQLGKTWASEFSMKDPSTDISALDTSEITSKDVLFVVNPAVTGMGTSFKASS
jgi:hypothetical protein